MQKMSVPFNIGLLHLTPEKLKSVKQVKALDILDGATTNFHPEGLFSTEIFGRVGDERRNLLFGYIDVKAPIFHPLIFMAITKLKRMYGDIMAGKVWALWDDSKKDFVKAKPSEGARTGYAFFLEHWKDIVYEEGNSNLRSEYIKLVEAHKETGLTRYIVVMPAGLRDLEIDEFNRKSEDEVNVLYRKFIALSNVIVESSIDTNAEVIDKPRFDMQLNFVALYDMIEALIKGKKKLFLGKVASRRIFNGTRNVITAMNTAVPVLGKKGTPGFNSTIIGLYQYLQASLPVSVAAVREFLAPMFPDVNSPAILVDPKTLRPRDVFLHVRYYDKWATTEGIEKIISSFKEEDIRNTPLVIDGYYLGLLYLGPDGTFKVFNDINQLPPTRLREHVRPLTLTDLFYLSVYRKFSKYPLFVTRYPVTGIGSIYPSKTHLRVTVGYEERRMLDESWIDAGDDYVAYEFPVQGSAFVNSLIPHSSHLKRLGADFDGDTASGNIAYSDEAIAEAEKFFQTKKAYIGTDGKLLYSCAVDTVELVLHSLTGEPAKPAVESFSLVNALEGYQEEEGGSFSHWGVKYDLNDVLDVAEHIKPETVKMSDVEWNVKDAKDLDAERVKNADTQFPLIAIREKGKIYVLDGNHRLRKLYDQGVKEVQIKFIDQDTLDIARLD
ncbi:putative RNA polymerase beta prime subunit [Ralstonia phage RP31]|uniref:Putative RNA polymerase beta prime subunit n=1 Tax=Ralstonia phage RP31 TaxID=1923890 RepID=A0A1L7N1E0_9CAUD|nr:putative RNA polymerase beta prime subunit [Ralstonia phage RP31]